MAETWEARYTAEVWGPEEAGAVTSRSSPAAVGRCVADQLASALLPLWRAAYGGGPSSPVPGGADGSDGSGGGGEAAAAAELSAGAGC